MVKPEASNDLRKEESEFEHQRNFFSSESSMFSSKAEELEATVKAMMTKSDNLIHNGKAQMIKAYTCKVCGKEGFSSNIKTHIESHHIDGVQISCNKFEKNFRSVKAI